MNKLRPIAAVVAVLTLLASAASTPGQEDDLRQRFGLQPVPPSALPREQPLQPRSR